MVPAKVSGYPAPGRANTGNGGGPPDGEENRYAFNEVILRNRLTALMPLWLMVTGFVGWSSGDFFKLMELKPNNGRTAVELIASR
ncbi:hypothetical protein CRYUN_Cryun01aG0151800 [Craigia yunnanensis]